LLFRQTNMSGQLNSFTIQLADETWLHVFSHLSQKDLCRVARVSTRFKRLDLDPSLWQKIELQKVSLSLEAWQGIVSRCSRLSSLTLRLQAVLRIRIRCLFNPWIRDPRSGICFFRIPDPKTIFLRAW
jgi:hypothetical protein